MGCVVAFSPLANAPPPTLISALVVVLGGILPEMSSKFKMTVILSLILMTLYHLFG